MEPACRAARRCESRAEHQRRAPRRSSRRDFFPPRGVRSALAPGPRGSATGGAALRCWGGGRAARARPRRCGACAAAPPRPLDRAARRRGRPPRRASHKTNSGSLTYLDGTRDPADSRRWLEVCRLSLHSRLEKNTVKSPILSVWWAASSRATARLAQHVAQRERRVGVARQQHVGVHPPVGDQDLAPRAAQRVRDRREVLAPADERRRGRRVARRRERAERLPPPPRRRALSAAMSEGFCRRERALLPGSSSGPSAVAPTSFMRT